MVTWRCCAAMAKYTFEAAQTDPEVLDQEFLGTLTNGFDDYQAICDATSWDELVRQTGLSEADLRRCGEIYVRAERTLIAWCLGVTQHEHGVDTAREIVNLLLLRGNLGRPGAGPSPVRGHSNVQGNRTCGIDHKPSDEWLDRLGEVCGIDPPAPPRHGHHRLDRGDARRQAQGVRRHGWQLRARRPGHVVHRRGPAPLRPDRPGQHQAQPQPPRARREGADPALPRPHREGRAGAAASRASPSRTR